MTDRQCMEEELLPLMQELIQNACVNDGTPESGNETRSVQTLQRYFERMGLEGTVLAREPHRGNLLLRIPGTNPAAPSLMFMGHLDVVPARADRWTVDPFGGVVKDGCLWGRGTVDMLNMTASMAVAMASTWRRRGPLAGDLLFLAVADEEAGADFGAKWLTAEHWDKVKADYMVTELGGFFINTGKRKKVMLTVGEKGVAWTDLVFHGTPGHGSMPYRADNAVLKAAAAAMRFSQYRERPHLDRVTRAMARALADSPLQRFLFSNPLTFDLALARLYQKSPGQAKFLHTASRNSFSPNTLYGGEKINIIAQHARLGLDIRVAQGMNEESLLRRIRNLTGNDPGVDIQLANFFPPNVSSLDTPLYRATASILNDAFGQVEPVPFLSGGVTDGRFWRSRGTTVYGFSMFDTDMTMTEYARGLHGTDERISLASLTRCLEYFTRLPERFFAEWEGCQ